MQDRFNTIAGWTLFAGIVALGSSIASGLYFQGDKPHRPHKMGYPIEGVVEEGGAEGPALATLLAAADPAAGEKVFAKCTSCHSIEQGGANGIGPNLFAILGKPIGKHAAGFAYSGDLAGLGGDWSYENMDKWLASPKAMAAGTKMAFPGLSKPEDRANVIAYLRDNGGGPPLPDAPAEEAAGGGDETATAAPGPEEAPGADAAGAVAAEQPEGGAAAPAAN